MNDETNKKDHEPTIGPGRPLDESLDETEEAKFVMDDPPGQMPGESSRSSFSEAPPPPVSETQASPQQSEPPAVSFDAPTPQAVPTQPSSAPGAPSVDPAVLQAQAMSQNIREQNFQTEVSPGQMEYAGFWARLAALFIDNIVLFLVSLVFSFLLGFIFFFAVNADSSGTANQGLDIFLRAFSLVLTWGYFIFLTHYKKATFGKMAVGIEVVGLNGGHASITAIILRETVGKLVSTVILGIGFLMAAFTEKKQGLHDMISGTVVVFRGPREQFKKRIIAINAIFISLYVLIIGFMIVMVMMFVALWGSQGFTEDHSRESFLKFIENFGDVSALEENTSENAEEIEVPAEDEMKDDLMEQESMADPYKDGLLTVIRAFDESDGNFKAAEASFEEGEWETARQHFVWAKEKIVSAQSLHAGLPETTMYVEERSQMDQDISTVIENMDNVIAAIDEGDEEALFQAAASIKAARDRMVLLSGSIGGGDGMMEQEKKQEEDSKDVLEILEGENL